MLTVKKLVNSNGQYIDVRIISRDKRFSITHVLYEGPLFYIPHLLLCRKVIYWKLLYNPCILEISIRG